MLAFILLASTLVEPDPEPFNPCGHWTMYWCGDTVFDTHFNRDSTYTAEGPHSWAGAWKYRGGVLYVTESSNPTNPKSWMYWGVVLNRRTISGTVSKGTDYQGVRVRLVRKGK